MPLSRLPLAAAALAAALAVSPAPARAQPTGGGGPLDREEVERLRAEVEVLKAETAELRRRLEALEELLAKAHGAEPPIAPDGHVTEALGIYVRGFPTGGLGAESPTELARLLQHAVSEHGAGAAEDYLAFGRVDFVVAERVWRQVTDDSEGALPARDALAAALARAARVWHGKPLETAVVRSGTPWPGAWREVDLTAGGEPFELTAVRVNGRWLVAGLVARRADEDAVDLLAAIAESQTTYRVWKGRYAATFDELLAEADAIRASENVRRARLRFPLPDVLIATATGQVAPERLENAFHRVTLTSPANKAWAAAADTRWPFHASFVVFRSPEDAVEAPYTVYVNAQSSLHRVREVRPGGR